MTIKQDDKIRGIIFIGAIISCFIALFNLYPLVYPDTGTYIDSGFRNMIPDDRPVFYGLFLRHVSLASSLWYVVFAQGLLVCYMLFTTLGIFFTGMKKNYLFISLVTFLTLFTGFSYNVSILIPDIFSAITVLCLVNLLLNQQLNRLQLVFISLLFVFSICTQFASFPIVMFLLLALGAYVLIKKPMAFNRKRLVLASALFLSSLVILPATNYAFSSQLKFSNSSHAFVINHFIETGILNDYLQKNCAMHNYKICQYKDELGWDFIWASDSPLQKTGGVAANKAEYDSIIRDILTTPKYLVMLAQKTLEYSVKQIFAFNVRITPPQLGHTAPCDQIFWRFKDTKMEYMSSLQNQNNLSTTFINAVQPLVILSSMVFLIVIMLSTSLRNKLRVELKWMVALILIHNLFNAIVCSNLSTIDNRFQNRLAWLLPFCAIIIVVHFLEARKKQALFPFKKIV